MLFLMEHSFDIMNCVAALVLVDIVAGIAFMRVKCDIENNGIVSDE